MWGSNYTMNTSAEPMASYHQVPWIFSPGAVPSLSEGAGDFDR